MEENFKLVKPEAELEILQLTPNQAQLDTPLRNELVCPKNVGA